MKRDNSGLGESSILLVSYQMSTKFFDFKRKNEHLRKKITIAMTTRSLVLLHVSMITLKMRLDVP